mmetsp:Transcript_114950/g.199255  ORF Transcript_114950/g.199255 Transcript_114950/m.199255 type:complete len:126 (+) Transcript_114950:965-1342(+)
MDLTGFARSTGMSRMPQRTLDCWYNVMRMSRVNPSPAIIAHSITPHSLVTNVDAKLTYFGLGKGRPSRRLRLRWKKHPLQTWPAGATAQKAMTAAATSGACQEGAGATEKALILGPSREASSAAC